MSTDQSVDPQARPRRVSAVLAGTAAVTLVMSVLGTPAHAAAVTSSRTFTDPPGDVWTVGEDEGWTRADDEPTADVLSADVRHRPTKLVVRMDFDDLKRQDPAGYTAAIITPTTLRGAFVSAGPGRWGGQRTLVNGRFGKVRCPGFQHSVDYAADRVVMSVPRSCLGRPDWVRVSMSNYMFRGETEESFVELTDNPHNTGVEAGTTRRIHRAS